MRFFSTRIEIYVITPEGLHLVADTNVYGRISVMRMLKLPVLTGISCRCNVGVRGYQLPSTMVLVNALVSDVR